MLRHNFREFDDVNPAQGPAHTFSTLISIPGMRSARPDTWQETVASDLFREFASSWGAGPVHDSVTETAPLAESSNSRGAQERGFENGPRCLHPDTLSPIEVHSDENLARLLASACPAGLPDLAQNQTRPLESWQETREQMQLLLNREGSESESLARVREAAAGLSSSLSSASDHMLHVWDLHDLEGDIQQLLLSSNRQHRADSPVAAVATVANSGARLGSSAEAVAELGVLDSRLGGALVQVRAGNGQGSQRQT